MKNILKKQSFLMKEPFTLSCYKNYKESVKWYCQLCELILTSKVQAQEHFFGKKHQSLIRTSKNFYNSTKSAHQSIIDSKIQVIQNGFQIPSKSVAKNNLDGTISTNDCNQTMPPPAGRDNILETVIKSEKKTFYSSDLSIYRTPSGKYYCQLCNLTVNSQAQFLQHSESRKHKQKTSRASSKIK